MVPVAQEYSLATHVNLDDIIVKVSSNSKWNNIYVNSIHKTQKLGSQKIVYMF